MSDPVRVGSYRLVALAAEVLAGTTTPRPVLPIADTHRPWSVFYDPWATPGAVDTAAR